MGKGLSLVKDLYFYKRRLCAESQISMVRSQFRAACVLLPVLLTGCASQVALQKPEEAPVAAASAVPTPPPKPAVTTSVAPEVMYQVLVAEVAMQRGQFDVAIKQYLDLAREHRDVRLAEQAASVAVYAHDNESALGAAKLWVERDPSNIEARQVLTAFYIRNGQLPEAQRQLEEVLAAVPEGDESAFMLIAGLLGRQQDKVAALQVMQRLIEARPKDPAALFAYSHLAVRTGALDEAEQAIRRVVELQPDRVDAVIQQARVLTMRGKADEALGLLEAAVKKSQKQQGLRKAYARMLVDAKQSDKAIKWYGQVDRGENYLEAQMRIAYLTAQKGDVDLAIAGLRDVAARGPAQVLRIYLVEGQLLRDAGRYQ